MKMFSRVVRFSVVVAFSTLLGCTIIPDKIDPEAGVDSPAAINAKLGLTYLKHGKYEVSKARLLKALKQDPNLFEAHHYIALLYREIDQLDLAGKHYRRAVSLNPEDLVLKYNYAVFLCGVQKRYDNAVETFLALANDRNYSRPHEAYQNAGVCLARKPDYVRAEKYLRKALELDERLPAALFWLSRINFENGKSLKARAFLQRYAVFAQHSAESLLLGYRLETALDDKEAADEYANQLQQMFPDSEELELLRAASTQSSRGAE